MSTLTFFNIFLERIMTDALEDHEGTVSIGGVAGEEEEMAKLVQRLDKTYHMEISAEKSKRTTNNTSSINTEI